MRQRNDKSGFTLVELIVSVTITGIIMVGLSVFFAGSFHNILVVQERISSTQGQFTTNEIVKKKIGDIKKVIDITSPGKMVMQNKIARGRLPWSYIGNDGNKLVFKDFAVFNGMYESTESSDIVPNNNHPSGITKVGGNYYITSSVNNLIYKCTGTDFDSCSEFVTTGLKHPTDITNNSTDLFVADSGNNRVVKINASTGSEMIESMATGLSFPMGLAFYAPNQLFVSDTYNNRVIKFITGILPIESYPFNESQIITVAGFGDDEDCDKTTARLCKLDFPTGLAIDTVGKNLYISDTGNARILKTSDPDMIGDLTAYPVTFGIGPTSQVSKIEFKFPNGTNLASVTETNDFHEGKANKAGGTYKYYLFVPIVDGNATKEDCNVPQGEPCKYYFERFTVNLANDIFQDNDTISIGSDTYSVPEGTGGDEDGKLAFFVDPDTSETLYTGGTPVKIAQPFGGDFTFEFDLTTALSPGSFGKITTEVYSQAPEPILTSEQFLRVGDGAIGTAEDTIMVAYDSDDGLVYPTGLGWDSGLQKTTTYSYSTVDLSPFDYTSDFDLATGGLTFSVANGTILQMDIGTTDPETYSINVALP